MHLTIRNFGPIKQGKLDLSKRFYVFVGYNNSGKTYVSQLLWAIFNRKTLSKFTETLSFDDLEFAETLSFDDLEIGEKVKSSSFEITEDLVKQVLNKFSNFLKEVTIPQNFNIPADHFIVEGFSLDFDFEMDKLIESADTTTRILAKVNVEEIQRYNELEIITLVKKLGSATVQIEEKSLSSMMLNDLPKQLVEVVTGEKKFLIRAMTANLILGCLLRSTPSPVFLPASRLFYPIFYSYIYRVEKEKRETMTTQLTEKIKELKKKLVGTTESGELSTRLNSLATTISRFESSYTVPMDFLFDKIYHFNTGTAIVNQSYQDLVTQLTKMMGGEFVMRRAEGIAPVEFHLKVNKKGEERLLPMYLSSSAVNQLGTLYLYLQYWAKEKNNFLLVDEPEENLHPRLQIELLNLLLEFANHNNNRVLITNHSPLMADMISNYHCLAFLEANDVPISHLIESYPSLREEINLKVEEMGIYFFDGQEIRSYKMGDYGVLFDDFAYELRRVKKVSNLLTEQIYQLLNKED